MYNLEQVSSIDIIIIILAGDKNISIKHRDVQTLLREGFYYVLKLKSVYF